MIAILSRNFYNGVMPLSQIKIIFSILLLVFSLNACSGSDSGSGNSSVPNGNQTIGLISEIHAQDDLEELSKIIKLPVTPSEAAYSEAIPINGEPNKKRFVAILKFSTADANQIASSAERYKPTAPADVDAENWFPPELIAKSQESGDAALKGVEYAANDFLLPPYTSGRVTRINDTNYFVLELFAF